MTTPSTSTFLNALVKLGHTVVRAGSASEGLDLLRHGEIRLVVTDWEMPEMDGLEFCRSVRTNDFNGYVYLIMLTGREGSRSRCEGLTAGADAFLTKPLDMKEMEVVLRNAERILSLETRDVALFALAKLAESRDMEVGGHIERVQSYTRLLAQSLAPASRRYTVSTRNISACSIRPRPSTTSEKSESPTASS